MERHFEIRIRPFTLRHKRLVDEGWLPEFLQRARTRIWGTLSLYNAFFSYSTEDNPSWSNNTTDLNEVEGLYERLLGIESNDRSGPPPQLIERVVNHESAYSVFDVLECFCAWIDDERAVKVQRALNDTFSDFEMPWRMSEGQIFIVDNAFMEDEVHAQVSPLLALAEFAGAQNEFKLARNAIVDGNAREAIIYAGASVESTYKAALGNSSKIGIELVDAYINANLMEGLPAAKIQAIKKCLMPTALLRNSLGAHGDGVETLSIPIEYAELAVGFAATINAFLAKQHLQRKAAASRSTLTKHQVKESSAEPSFDDEDIPF